MILVVLEDQCLRQSIEKYKSFSITVKEKSQAEGWNFRNQCSQFINLIHNSQSDMKSQRCRIFLRLHENISVTWRGQYYVTFYVGPPNMQPSTLDKSWNDND